MPLIDGKQITPAAAMTAGRCPECGDPVLRQVAVGHGKMHWPNLDERDPAHTEARKRMRMLENYAATSAKED